MILFDEPSAGLDPVTSSVIDELIISLSEQTKATSVIVTHEMDSAFRIATRMVMLYEGKFIADGPPSTFRPSDNPVVAQVRRGPHRRPDFRRHEASPSRSARRQPNAAGCATARCHQSMKFERNETLTGLLVLSTVGLLVLVVLLLSAPGFFKAQDRFQIFFDNAAGVKQGAPVLVAGRQIGQVASIQAPVPRAQRPAKYPEDEVLLTVRINHGATVYRDATPRMLQNGLLGEQVIDFVGGTEDSGKAPNDYKFVGERVPDLNSALPRILAVIEPVASTATLTLSELRKTIDTLNSVFGQEGDMNGALMKLRLTADNLTTITSPDGALSHSLSNFQDFTNELKSGDGPLMGTLNNLQKTTAAINKDNRVEKVLANFESASARADTAARNANALLVGIRPSVQQTTENLAQMTDTLKRQPWRIIWPSTKKYDGPSEATDPANLAPSPVVAARTRHRVVSASPRND